MRVMLEADRQNPMPGHGEADRVAAHELQTCGVRVPQDAQVHEEEIPRDVLPIHALQVSVPSRLLFHRSCQRVPGPLPGVTPDADPGVSVRHLVHGGAKPQ